MTEQESKTPMTEYDKKVVAHIENIITQRKAGKLKYLTHDYVFGNLRIKIARAEKKKMASFQTRIAQAESHRADIYKHPSPYAASI